ncbi:MAG: alpha/beta hydrolase [Pseudomonadales bacterium]|jgi:alpha/beta superfamily hydrolase|nr:alpha/beta hydrolase [Pseudomonadales bacterium]
MIEAVTIDGPAGDLEGRLERPETGSRGAALLCHPHPRFGGSLDDAVLSCAAAACRTAGLASLRFNFRGVGASAGRFDEGIGEQDDALASARWLTQRVQGPLWLVGYSFGAWVLWHAAPRMAATVGPCALILIAPPMDVMPFSRDGPSALPVHAWIGDQDAFAAAGTVRDRLAVLAPPGRTQVVTGADHFFTGRLAALEGALGESFTA